ncbi:MAG: site-2 protease family protein [Thermoplasmatota archaeon]
MDEWPAFPLRDNTEHVRRIVARYFTIYGEREDEAYSYYVDMPIESDVLQQRFEQLRLDLKEERYVPLLRREQGEYVLRVVKQPRRKTRPEWLNLVLFFVTIVTTMLSGSMLFVEYLTELTMSEFLTVPFWEQVFVAKHLLYGLGFFSFPLMTILGIHEYGHYYISKKHNVAASLPFFIPIPPNPFLPLGTMGAVISMREPIPNRKALIEIGIAGPIAGFLVAIPVCIAGLLLMQEYPVFVDPGGLHLNPPLLFIGLEQLFTFPTPPPGKELFAHPTVFAGWVGLLVTAINLLPAGQLDGGHIARGALRDKHKYASFGAIGLLIATSFMGGGWLFFALFIVFIIGVGHPPALNEYVPLSPRLKGLAVLALVIFALSFVPVPISG